MHHASDHGFSIVGQLPAGERSAIDPNVSDLFFNTDISEAKQFEGNKFVGLDYDKLLDAAKQFSETFERATGTAINPHMLMKDFLDRI